jgi:hypothetical protein
MKRLFSAVRRPALAGLLGLTAVLASATPASATGRYLSIHGSAVCDREAGEFAVTWTIENANDVAGTIGNVRVYPPSRPLVGMPHRIQPHETIQGTQRLLRTEYTGHLQLDVNWDDGVVVHDYHWPIYIKVGC